MSVEFAEIGQRIRQQRKLLGKTQQYLAEGMDVTIGYISQLERGIAKSNLETLQTIADLLECNIAFLITGVGSVKNDEITEEILKKIHLLSREQKEQVLELILSMQP